MRKFNWTSQSCKILDEKVKRYIEVSNFYTRYLQNFNLWGSPERYEKHIQPVLNELFDYVETLGFTREEAETALPIFYESPSAKAAFEKYARNLSSIIYKGE